MFKRIVILLALCAPCAAQVVEIKPPDGEQFNPNTISGEMSPGADHQCAVMMTGNVYCMGKNDKGQLGLGYADGKVHGWEPVGRQIWTR